MSKNYVYRIHHDTGFAPNTKYGICTLSGCKNRKIKNGKRNIEELAEKGSWVIGIGGNYTRKPNKLIYVMEVEKNLPYSEFKEKYSEKSKYLLSNVAGSNVLVSKKFFYFGDKAIDLPKNLEHIIWDRQGYICISDKDIDKLRKFLIKKEYTKYGIFGLPNNSETSEKCGIC